jgi:hypothetical protein
MHLKSILTYAIAFIGMVVASPAAPSAEVTAPTHSPVTNPATSLNATDASNSTVGILASFPNPSVKSMYACSDRFFSGACFQFYWTSVNTGCLNGLDFVGMQDTISSATPEPGRTCTLYR